MPSRMIAIPAIPIHDAANMPLFWIRQPEEKKPGHQRVGLAIWSGERTGIDGCPVPEHADLAEISTAV